MTELEQAARAAGIIDMDGLAFVDTTLPTIMDQVRDLARRKPQFFAQRVRDMTPQQYAAARAAVSRPAPPAAPSIGDGKHVRDMTAAEYQQARRTIR